MSEHLSTKAVHAGEERPKPYGAITTPIVQSSTFTFESSAQIQQFMQKKLANDPDRHDEYGRYTNPTQRAVEKKMAAIEGSEHALLFASGMAAISTTMLTVMGSGDHLVMISDCYHKTKEFALTYLKRFNIETTLVPVDRPEAMAEAVRPNTRLLFSETPTNPYLRVADIPAMVTLGKKHGILTAIDSTFATPVNLLPLTLGVDLVIHSATKYLGGHNDLLAGVLAGSARHLEPIEKVRGLMGGMGNPNDAYLLLRGLKTLELRVRRQNENGLRVAQFLESHPAVERVWYPGLPSHPDHEKVRQQLSGFGGVVSFEVRGDFELTGRVIDRLRLPFVGPTLGGVESIIQQSAAFFSLNPDECRAAGFKDNLLRYALGIENAEDIIADLDQALAIVKTRAKKPPV